MLKALVPEIWPAPSQYHRPCQGVPYIHPATERNPAMYYDQYGYCDPTMTSGTTVVQAAGIGIGTILLIGGIAFLAWKYRKKLF